MARLVLALAFCVGAANGLGKTEVPDCTSFRGASTPSCDEANLGGECQFSGIGPGVTDGVCVQQGGIPVCTCCVGGEGLVIEFSDPPYFGVDPETVLPECP